MTLSKVAPILTIFVGGNHEASGYLWELYHGGWVAPNIYFLGFAGSVILRKVLPDGSHESIRISGASGIYKQHDYHTGHHERLPYNNGTIRSIYHVRAYDVFRLGQLPVSSSSDIFISHDWPVGIEQHGDTARLLRAKPFFRDEVASNTLGSPPLMHLLRKIKPHYWFSAHLHVKFAAVYHHGQLPHNHSPDISAVGSLNPDELKIDDDDDQEERQNSSSLKTPAINPDMISIEDSDDEIVPSEKHADPQSSCPVDHFCQAAIISGPKSAESDSAEKNDPTPHGPQAQRSQVLVEQHHVTSSSLTHLQNPTTSALPRVTRFLALDKCLPRKDFLQILDIHPSNSVTRVPIATTQHQPDPDLGDSTEVQNQSNPDNQDHDPQEVNDSVGLFFDPHWLAITRAFHSYMPLQKYGNPNLPTNPSEIQSLINTELEWVKQNVNSEDLKIDRIQRFVKTAPGIGDPGGEHPGQPLWYTNPQTLAFTELLKIENKINPLILNSIEPTNTI